MEGEDRAGSLIVFDPSGEGCVEIEYVGAVTAVAVPHTGGQVEAHGGGSRRASGLEDGIVVIDGVLRCDEPVGEAVIEDEFAAAGEEGIEVGIGCGEGSAVDLLRDGDIAVEVEGAGGPLGVFEDDVSEVRASNRKPWRGEGVPCDLAAGFEAGEDLFVGARVGRAGVDFARGFDLFGRETGGGFGAFALGDCGIEVAGEGIPDDAILDAVGCVAGIECGLMEDGELLVRQIAGGREVGGLFNPDGAGEEMLKVIGGGSGDDAVEVVRVALSFHEALPASGGAAIPVGALLRFAIEGGDDCFGFYGRLVLGAITVVDDLFRMAEGEASVGVVTMVTGIGGGGGVSVADGGCHEMNPWCSGEAPVANLEKPVVPVGGRHPDLEADDGVGDGRDGSGDAAEEREPVERRAGGLVVKGGEVALLGACEGDGRVGELESAEALACGCEDVRRGEKKNGESSVASSSHTYRG